MLTRHVATLRSHSIGPMPSSKSYPALHEKVLAPPGAEERLAALRSETLAEIGLYALRRTLERSQADIAVELGIIQSAASQLERDEGVGANPGPSSPAL